MSTALVLSLVVLSLVAVPASADTMASASGEDHCQDPRILGTTCFVCWTFLQPLELHGPWEPRFMCAETEAPEDASLAKMELVS